MKTRKPHCMEIAFLLREIIEQLIEHCDCDHEKCNEQVKRWHLQTTRQE